MNATAPIRGGGISNSSESSTRAEGIALVELLCIGAVGPVHLHGHVHLIAEHHADAIGCAAYHHRWRTDCFCVALLFKGEDDLDECMQRQGQAASTYKHAMAAYIDRLSLQESYAVVINCHVFIQWRARTQTMFHNGLHTAELNPCTSCLLWSWCYGGNNTTTLPSLPL